MAEHEPRARWDVEGYRVVVTGAASGLGRAMAEAMAAGGATVVGGDVDQAGLEAVAAEWQQRGWRLIPVPCDVADLESVQRLFDRAVEALGGVDVAFANAGVAWDRGFLTPGFGIEEFPIELWHRVMSVNLHGVFHTLKAAARVMKPQRRGSIIVTASTAGLRSEPMVGYGYITAKAGVINLTKQAALELAGYGIRVNAIAPGPFKTHIGGHQAWKPEDEEPWRDAVLLQRMADPSEIQGLALFLASSASSFVTGAVFPIDGGATALSQLPARSLGPRT
ncbi:MAG: SDR family oxidoreductase [Firmicutes bacterium]|nr:SDR family oxidoreductase [Alicyclobacillaceae bacterium]MCL6496225.1 SDR family oxidoreductase [Bacillota bacterium]